MQVNDHENGVPPEWMHVERVVAVKGGNGTLNDGTQYLVKWEVLGYQDCTWEAAEDLAGEEVRLLFYKNCCTHQQQQLLLYNNATQSTKLQHAASCVLQQVHWDQCFVKGPVWDV